MFIHISGRFPVDTDTATEVFNWPFVQEEWPHCETSDAYEDQVIEVYFQYVRPALHKALRIPGYDEAAVSLLSSLARSSSQLHSSNSHNSNNILNMNNNNNPFVGRHPTAHVRLCVSMC
eukprot:PhM_4_TR7793/c0_g1_i1/m.94783